MTSTARPLREVYRDHVVDLMSRDERLVCVDTDTGLFGSVDFGGAAGRYLNVGIAEHTAMAAAAGLAKEGYRPLVHTMAAFAASRALEAVKIDIALNELPVLIAATHAGLSAGSLGPTHHGLEDLAVMRTLPHMRVVVPSDDAGTRDLLGQALASSGPTYLRLGRDAAPELPAAPPARLGQAQVLRRGPDVTLAACGPHPVLAALAAAEALARDGIRATVLNLHTVKPLDVDTLADAAAISGGQLVTVEEAWAMGGFGSAVAEALTEVLPVQVHKVAVPDSFVAVAGDQQHLLDRTGITTRHVAARARMALHLRRPAATPTKAAA